MKLKRILALLLCFAMVLGTMSIPAFADGNVAKVGNTEYKTIDEAIANWTNNTTLTLLSDVTLSDVIKLSSTEYHILDLGTYTMTAAKNKDAIQYIVNGRSNAGHALDIKADAINPGGITATGKTVVSHIKPSSGAPSKDRPITRFYGGVFNASYVVKQGGSGLFLPGAGYTGASAPYFQFYGGEYNGTIYTNRSQNQFYGGTFNGNMQMSVDSSAYTLVAGGTFKNLSNSMGSDLNSDKFTIGSSKGANNGSVCIDENGYYVISTTTPTEAEASVASNYNSNNYFYYSTVNTNGMYYEDVYDALEANKTGTVTVLTDELDLTNSSFTGTIVVPEGETITIIVEEGTTPTWTIDDSTEAAVTYTDTEGNELVKDDDGSFAPVDSNAGITVDGIDIDITPVDGIENSYDITLAEGATWTEGTSVTMTFPAVEGASDGDSAYVVHEHEDGTYIYVGTVKNGVISFTNNVGFSTFTVYAGGLQEALAAASSGDEIVLLADVTEDVTIPAGVIFNGNGFAVSGGIIADGNITFAGITKAKDFDVNYVGTTINIGKGASLELTGSDRLVIGHGCTFNIEGNIVDAKTANVAELTPSLIMPGASFTGAGVTFNVKNAYINAPSSYCSSSKSASGTFDFNIANSIIKTAGKLAFEAQSTAATVNFELKDSVLTTGSHLVFGVSKGEIVIDNSDVNVGTSKQIENQSTMTIKNGSVVNGAVATSSNAKNPGTLIIENATYSVTGEFSGSDVGTGTIVIMDGSSFTAGKITNANIRIDAANMSAGDEINLTADLSGLTGTVEVINNNLVANIVDGKIVLAKTPVAAVNGVEYDDIQEAIKAAAPNGTVTLLSDVTVDEWKMISETLSISDGSIITIDEINGLTIDGNDYTLTVNDIESASNGGYLFYDATNLNIKNLTIKVADGLVGGIGLSSGVISGVTFIGGKYAVIPGAGGVRIEGCNFNDTKGYAVYFEEARPGIIVTGNTFNTASGAYAITMRDNEQFTDNTIVTGRVNLASTAKSTVTGNDFGNERFKVYNDATAKIDGNTINNLVFDKSIGGIKVTFGSNTLSAAAQQALNAVTAPVEVSTYEQLIEELAKENANIKLISDITADAAQSSGYGKAGIVVDAGDVLDGNGHKLTINGANTTWDCVVAMRGGEVKNLTIAGAMRGVFMPGANGDVVVDNCVMEDVIYTFNSDAGSKNHTVTIKNTVLNGWTSFSDAHKAVTFENCDFGEGNGYAFCRPYQKTTFIDCDFAKGYEFDTAQVASNSFEFNNCKYDGEALSEDSWKMFYNGGSVVINGKQICFMNHDNIVAHIGNKNYDSLAKAIAAAQAGDIITLVSDVTENVTINKSITLDGNGKTYTGTMTVNAGITATVQNVNFVNGGIDKSSKSTTGNYTIKNCTFDGKDAFAYPLRFKGAASITVEDCAVKDYMYSFLYISHGTNTVSVKNVTVEDCPNYAVFFSSGVNSATIENMTVKNSNNGLIINNTANRALTIKDCKFENVGTAVKNSDGTKTITCTVLGANDFGTAAPGEYSKYVLAEGAELEAASGFDVTTNVEGNFVKYADGKYKVVKEEVKPLHRILLISNMELRENNGVLYYPVHVYAGIDSLNYKEVGFMFNVKNTETPQGEERTYKTKTVYTGMNVKQSDGTVDKVLASELGGKYMFGHNMNFKTTSYSNADTEIEITPYAIKLDGTTITGDPISITDAKIKAKYPNSALFKEETNTEEEN